MILIGIAAALFCLCILLVLAGAAWTAWTREDTDDKGPAVALTMAFVIIALLIAGVIMERLG